MGVGVGVGVVVSVGVGFGGVFFMKVCIFNNLKMHIYLIFNHPI